MLKNPHKLFPPSRVSIYFYLVMEERRKLISTFNILHVLESNKPHALVQAKLLIVDFSTCLVLLKSKRMQISLSKEQSSRNN